MSPPKKLVVGGGYVGHRVARRWQAAGHDVAMVTRSAARATQLAAEGIQPLVADVMDTATLRNLPHAQSVLFAVARDRQAPYTMHSLYVDGLRHLLDALLPSPPDRFLYVSSTGVYGQTDGEWIDESSPCDPKRPGGVAALQAEQTLQAHAIGSRALVLRLAGIYGPGRVPMLETLRRHEPIAADPQSVLNLIHVEDAVEVIVQADRHPASPATYLVSDGHPVRRGDYYSYLAELAGLPSPVYVQPDPHAAATERGLGHKRVSNRRMCEEIGVRLAFPSYHVGLAAILAANGTARPL